MVGASSATSKMDAPGRASSSVHPCYPCYPWFKDLNGAPLNLGPWRRTVFSLVPERQGQRREPATKRARIATRRAGWRPFAGPSGSGS